MAEMPTMTIRNSRPLRLVFAALRALVVVRMALPEILTGAGLIGGWALVTWGLASLTVWQVWPMSLGLLLISLGGWRLAAVIVLHGLYSLGKREEAARE